MYYFQYRKIKIGNCKKLKELRKKGICKSGAVDGGGYKVLERAE